ncbi:MAG TPA: YoaK family protein [Bryobacteraceae bacterium]|nr:YoaK family protein [Bryobacteraceae bacterium]
MKRSHPLAQHAKAWVAVFMAWAAGFVDAACWLAIERVYTSHMTGNTASFARSVVEGNWSRGFLYGWVILPFMAGLIYSAAVIKASRRRGIHSSFSIALTTEVLALAAFIGLASGSQARGRWMVYLLLALPAAAMGMQTVTVTRINGLRVYTTYLTGSLSKCAEAVVDFAFWFRDRTRGRSWKRLQLVLLVTPRHKRLQHAALTAGLWVGFFAGATSGVWAEGRFAYAALIAPIGVLIGATVVDLARPVAAADDPPAHRQERF